MIEALRRKIKDEKFLNLIWAIINSDPDPGLSIGFYLNQWLANFLLEPLDHFICTLDGAKCYVRNMDDIVVMGPNKRKLHKAREKISRYLETMLGLELKADWQIFPVDSRGIDFVGYRFFHFKTILRRRNFQKLRRNVRTVNKFLRTGRKIPVHAAQGLLSRAGQLKHCNGQNVFDKYIKPIGENRLKKVIREQTLREGGKTMIMQLNTKEEITIAAFGHEHIVVDCESIENFRQIHDKMLADGAMDTVTIEDSGQTIATIHGATIAGTQTVAVVGDPKKVTGHFYLQGGTYDLDGGEYAQAGRILLGEE